MKCIFGLFVCAAAMFAQAAGTGQNAEFVTGQAARALIGQSTFTSQDPNSSDVVIGAASGIAYAADTLFVADSNRVGATPSNHRVLIYRGLSSMLPSPTAELSYSAKCPVCVGRANVVIGQPDFATTTENIVASPSDLRLPTAVASDGVHVIVADTNHNRVLIWNSIPAVNNQRADVVIGQPDFASASVPSGGTPTASSLRGPQGVWIQNGRLFVADTQNNRILIYNSIPTKNGQAADVVLGQPNFTTFVQPDVTQQTVTPTAENMVNPVSVTSDGVHLFVTDLGNSRVLIWNSIPTQNDVAADVVIGQPGFTTAVANNAFTTDANGVQTAVLCTTSTGKDTNGNPQYPAVCNATLDFPRFALAGGGRLFIADGGNDRVLVFNTIPTANGASADSVLGQIGGSVNQASDAADSLRGPQSLAWDGTNLYVSDAYNRRITIYSIAPTVLPYQAVRNAAQLDIFANASVAIGGTITAGNTVTITIGGTDYKYTIKSDDTVPGVVKALVGLINTGNGDPNVFATADLTKNAVVLTARQPGEAGNGTTLSTTLSSNATILVASSGSTLTGGGDAAKIAPGTLVSILAGDGTTFTDRTGSADITKNLPTTLAGVQVYFNGIPSPVSYVSPTQINAQVPWEISDSTSINAYVRAVLSDGTVNATSPVAVTIVPANPGVFSIAGTDPIVGMFYHASSKAIGIVDVEGSPTANDVVSVTIENRTYSYTVQSADTITTVRDNLAAAIQDPKVTAEPSGEYTRIVLKARVDGPDGNGITYTTAASSNATEVMTAFTPQLCCANVEGAPVTVDNPAVPGEFVYLYATGLGLPVLTDDNKNAIGTGIVYQGPETAPPIIPSGVSALAGGRTADVISATLEPGTVGLFRVTLHLNQDLPSDIYTSVTIAQDVFVSKAVRVAVQSLSGQ